MCRFFHTQRGMGLIEVVVGVGIFIIIITSIIGAYRLFVRFSGATSDTVQAYFLLEEGLEVARILRDANWDTFAGLTSAQPYYLVFSGGVWEATTTADRIDGRFERTIAIFDTYRNGDDDIAASGTLDPDTYLVTATVSWDRAGVPTTKTMSTYLTNLFE